MGLDVEGTVKNMKNIADYGFINVKNHVIKSPIGLWPKNKTLRQIDHYQREVSADGIAGVAYGPLCRGAGWTKEEVDLYIVDVRKSLMDSKVHSYYPFHVIYGQKPLDG
jgi:hypothetical protein